MEKIYALLHSLKISKHSTTKNNNQRQHQVNIITTTGPNRKTDTYTS